jgi:hypothetical protein
MLSLNGYGCRMIPYSPDEAASCDVCAIKVFGPGFPNQFYWRTVIAELRAR